MEVIDTAVDGVKILVPQVFGDNRGWFMESWSKKKMEDAGLFYDFVQDNQSYSSVKGTIRGLHFQYGGDAQAKLVRCVKGVVLDVAVDIRKGSPTYKKWVAVELTPDNFKQLLIPRGCAHGFLTLTDEVEFVYKEDNLYAPQSDRNIIWNDPDIEIDWGIDNPILSDKDAKAPRLCDVENDEAYMNFTFK